MHNHGHGCEHYLIHCAHCDVVYCNKCSKEWGRYYYNYTYPYYPYTYPQWAYTTVGKAGTISLGAAHSCTHHGGTNA